MRALIPAAGCGTRLRPLTDDKPKALVDIAGEPLLGHILGRLERVGLEEAVVVIGYRGDQIVDHFGGGWGDLSLRYVVQDEPLGLAHAHLCAEHAIDEPFLSVNGDNLHPVEALRRIVEMRDQTGADVTTLVEDVTESRAQKTSVLEFDEDGNVSGLVEKPDDPPSLRAPIGCYAFPTAIFEACRRIEPSDRGEYELPDAIDLLLEDGYELVVESFEGRRFNINTHEALEEAERAITSESAEDAASGAGD